MKPDVKALIDRGYEIRRDIKKLNEELEEIETKLEAAALAGDHVELKDKDREGRRFLARGTFKIVPVIFTADKLIGSFQKDSQDHKRIEPLAGIWMETFFKSKTVYGNQFKDGKEFRTHADKMMGKAAPAFITACLARDKHGIPKSDTKIEWDGAEDVTKGN